MIEPSAMTEPTEPAEPIGSGGATQTTAAGSTDSTGTTEPDPAPSATVRARLWLEHSAVTVDRYWPGRLWSRLLEVEFIDRAVALAAKAFVSLFPFVIVIAAITPERVRAEIVDDLMARFGLSGDVLDTIGGRSPRRRRPAPPPAFSAPCSPWPSQSRSPRPFSGCTCGHGVGLPAVG